jgi:hypothetical protein
VIVGRPAAAGYAIASYQLTVTLDDQGTLVFR